MTKFKNLSELRENRKSTFLTQTKTILLPSGIEAVVRPMTGQVIRFATDEEQTLKDRLRLTTEHNLLVSVGEETNITDIFVRQMIPTDFESIWLGIRDVTHRNGTYVLPFNWGAYKQALNKGKNKSKKEFPDDIVNHQIIECRYEDFPITFATPDGKKPEVLYTKYSEIPKIIDIELEIGTFKATKLMVGNILDVADLTEDKYLLLDAHKLRFVNEDDKEEYLTHEDYDVMSDVIDKLAVKILKAYGRIDTNVTIRHKGMTAKINLAKTPDFFSPAGE